MDAKVNIYFSCIKCKCPIQLDEGFSHLSEHAKAEMSLQVFKGKEFVLPSEETMGEQHPGEQMEVLMPISFSSDTDQDLLDHQSDITGIDYNHIFMSPNGYSLQGSAAVVDKKKSPHEVTSQLLDMASSHSEVDHPMCLECTTELLQLTTKQLEFCEENAECYKRNKEEVKRMPLPSGDSLQQELDGLEAVKLELETELGNIMAEQKLVKRELEEKQKQEATLNAEEERLLIETIKTNHIADHGDELKMNLHNLKYEAQEKHQRLKKSNVFNLVFHIWNDDDIATINNFRIGKTSATQVPWPEINAGLGQMAFLMVSVARKFDVTFRGYEIFYHGNHSYVKERSSGKILPLHNLGTITSYFNSNFDMAMGAFLECFEELVQKMERIGGLTIPLPYPIVKHSLHDPKNPNVKVSIKTQFVPFEEWTKAVKYLLSNMKLLLSYISTQALSSYETKIGHEHGQSPVRAVPASQNSSLIGTGFSPQTPPHLLGGISIGLHGDSRAPIGSDRASSPMSPMNSPTLGENRTRRKITANVPVQRY